MVRVFIVEQDINVIKKLERIITDKGLGILIGYAKYGISGLEKIEQLQPNLVLIDYNIPKVDGISVVREIKKRNNNIQFIMISDETSKFVIEQAYRSGVEYYIHKPISGVEIENVIERIVKDVELKHTLGQIQKLIYRNNINDSNNAVTTQSKCFNNCEKNIKQVLQDIGLYGKTGSKEIVEIIKYLIENDKNISDYPIKELCSYFTDNPKWMEQRIRRLVTSGMINLANLGIEDYLNEAFTEYSNSIYNFKQVKKEMDYIRGNSKERGKINLKKFIGGLVFYCEK